MAKINKKDIHEILANDLESRINTLQSEFKIYMESAANESKSTAGDKHDTSKSMMQLEQEKLSAQLSQLREQKKVLSQIDPSKRHQVVGFGSLVETNHGKFYISISSRSITHQSEQINYISIISPIGRAMQSKSNGFEFSFMGKHYIIQDIQ